MPKYKEVAEKIRERIKSKEYAVDERIPDQHSLAEEFGTSRVTIKRALDLLTTAGLVYTIQGSGTYVKRNALLQAQSSRPQLIKNTSTAKTTIPSSKSKKSCSSSPASPSNTRPSTTASTWWKCPSSTKTTNAQRHPPSSQLPPG